MLAGGVKIRSAGVGDGEKIRIEELGEVGSWMMERGRGERAL